MVINLFFVSDDTLVLISLNLPVISLDTWINDCISKFLNCRNVVDLESVDKCNNNSERGYSIDEAIFFIPSYRFARW